MQAFRPIVSLLCMFACAAPLAAESAPPTIANASFEDTENVDGRILPKGWVNAFPFDAKIYVFPKSWANNEDSRMNMAASAAAKRSGELGLELKQAGGPRMYAQSEKFDLPAQGDKWHEITVYARSTKDRGAWAQIQVFRGGLVAASDEVLLTETWQPIVCRIKQGGAGMHLRLLGWVIDSDVHFDDVSVKAIDPPGTEAWMAYGGTTPPTEPTGRELFMKAPSPASPGELYVERPTHHTIGMQWAMSGDNNRNATVDVSYREKGATEWKVAVPLHRTMWESIKLPMTGGHVTPNQFAGSVFGLEPGQAYEIRLALNDPDGGSTVKTFEAATRPIPPRFEGTRVLHVYPSHNPFGHQPAYAGLQAAYDDAMPGDVLLVHEGFYNQAPDDDGRVYRLNKKAKADKPIVIRGAPGEMAVFDGRRMVRTEKGAFHNSAVRVATALFDMNGAEHHHIENIVALQCHVAFLMRNSVGVVIRGCFIEPLHGYGVGMEQPTVNDMTIRDNVFYGGLFEFWDHRDEWLRQRGGYSAMHRPYAIFTAGQGHDIAYNKVYGWHDGINMDTYWPPPADPKLRTCSVDVHHNIITGINDDGMELEPAPCNIIVRENIFTRCFMALSFQATYGGPIYIIRNVIYDIDSLPFKHVHSSAGTVMYHNTVLVGSQIWLSSSSKNGRFMNNLFMNTSTKNPIISGSDVRPLPQTLDYNGYGPGTGPFPWSVSRELHFGTVSQHTYPDLAAFAQGTGHEMHGVAGLTLEETFVRTEFDQDRSGSFGKPHDLCLKDGSRAIDAGAILPTINDDFTGKAPDLGAYEKDLPLPHYGPRPEWDPEGWKKKRTPLWTPR